MAVRHNHKGLEYHQSVLLREVLDLLDVKKNKWYLDATLGDGGHSIGILKRGGKVFGIDVDPEALERALRRFKAEAVDNTRFIVKKRNFNELDKGILGAKEYIRFEGEVFDLGVSSLQLDKAERGFSFQALGPLDMRMDPNLQVKAADLVNALNTGELYELIKNYSQDPNAKRLAQAVADARPIRTTGQLAEIVEKSVRKRRGKIHPATRVFQALRIAVNNELQSIKEGIPKAFDKLAVNGVLCVISYHSLEDRIIKNLFRDWSKRGYGVAVTKKPIMPSIEELGYNTRARSAKLRAFIKTC